MSGRKIDRQVVIAVLRAHGVGVEEGPSKLFVMEKGNRTEAQRLPDMVDEKLVRYLSRNYGIDVEKFHDLDLGASDTPA